MKRYWISWYQPTEDYRPLKWPLPKEILGWWCSGLRCSDDASTLVAWVEAESNESAEKLIKKYWPEAKEWRFNDEVELDWKPNDRFPVEVKP